MSLEELNKLIESRKQTVVINKGIGPLSLLGIAFVVMKIMGYITWSWWWVLAPFWIPICLALVLLVLIIGLVLLAATNVVNAKVEVKEETVVTPKEEDENPKEEVKETSKKKTSRKKKTNTEEDGESTEGKNGKSSK